MEKNLLRKNLINSRKNKSLTQEELAEKLKLSTRQYQALEAGTSDGSIKKWYKLKEILGVETIDFLLEQEIEEIQENDSTKRNTTQE